MALQLQIRSELGKMLTPFAGHVDDIIVLDSKGDKKRVYVRHGAHLAAFNVSLTDQNQIIWKPIIANHQMFNEAKRKSYPLRTYPWFVTDTMLDDGSDGIIIRKDAGFFFYRFDPRESGDSLQELSRDTSFMDLYSWNEANLFDVVLIGRIYPDTQLIGVMRRKKTRKDSVAVEFYSVDKDRLMTRTPYPLFPLGESYLDKDVVTRISHEAIDLYLADLQRSGQDNIILRTKNHQLEMYKFDDNYHLQPVAKLLLRDESQSQTERFFFVDLTGQSYRDVVHFNQHGLYVYQMANKNMTDYALVHYHAGFSTTNGWIPEYGESIRLVDVNGDGRDDLLFTGPKGLTVLGFDPENLRWKTLLDPSTQLDVSHRFATVVAAMTSGLVLATDKQNQLFVGQLLVKNDPLETFQVHNSPTTVQPVNRKQESLHAKIPSQVKKRIIAEKPILRWAEQWADPVSISNIIDPVSGSLDFSLPIFQPNHFDPVPHQLLLSYQSQWASISNIVGSGWSFSLPDSYILVDYQGSIFLEDATFYLVKGDGLLQLKSFKVKDGVRLFRQPLQPQWTVEYREKEQRWIIDTETGRYIFGSKDKMKAIRYNLNWPRWRGPGNDVKSLKPIPVAWYLIEVQVKTTGRSIIYKYEIDSVDYQNSTTKWTAAIRLKQISVESFTSLTFDYTPKEKEEYQLFEPPFDSRNNQSISLVFPVPLRESHYLTGCNIVTEHYRQHIVFKYETDQGKRLLTAIEQPMDAHVRESIIRFSYKKDDFMLNEIKFPRGLKVQFRYDTISDIDLPDPYSIVGHPVEEQPDIDYSRDYAAMVFKQRQVPDKIQVKILGVDSHETLTELSSMEATTQAEGKVTSYNVRSHEDFFIVFLKTDKSQKICLFHRSFKEGKIKWNRDPICRWFSDKALIRSSEAGVAVANGDKTGVVQLFQLSNDQSEWIEHQLTSGRTIIRFEMVGHLIAGYDDHQLFICNPDGTNEKKWQIHILERLPDLFSDGEAIVKKFQFPTEMLSDSLKKQLDFQKQNFLEILKENLLQLSGNSIAVSSLHLSDDHQLILRIRLFLLSSNYMKSRRREFTIQIENVLELRSEIKHEDSRYQLGYRVTKDDFYLVKLFNLSGNLVNQILTTVKENRVKGSEILADWKKNVSIRRDFDFKSFDNQMRKEFENFKSLISETKHKTRTNNRQEETSENEKKSCDHMIFAPCNEQCYKMEKSFKSKNVDTVFQAKKNLDKCHADHWKEKWEKNIETEGKQLQQINEKLEKEILEVETEWAQMGIDSTSNLNQTQKTLLECEKSFAGVFLLKWPAYQIRMNPEGLWVGNGTFIRMVGDDWKTETNKSFINNQKYSIPLGESFILMDDSDNNEIKNTKNMTLYARESNQSMKPPLHRLLEINRIISRYPVYLAYENRDSTKVILFKDDGKTLGNVLTFPKEQLVSESSSYKHLTTLAISQTAEKMKLLTRSLRSINPVNPDAKRRSAVHEVKMSNNDANLTRSTGYQWDNSTKENVTLTIIPGNDRKLAGWLKETWIPENIPYSGKWIRKTLEMFDADGQSVQGPTESNDKSSDSSNESILWDFNNRRIVSDFSPYKISDQMVSYYGFESYEVNSSSWRFVESNVIEGGFALTGSHFLRLNNSSLEGTFTPVDQQTIYVASCWIRPLNGSLDSTIEEDLEMTTHLKAIVKVKETGGEIVGLLGRIMRIRGDWFYVEVLIDFGIAKRLFHSQVGDDQQDPPFTITIKIQAQPDIKAVMDVDHVRFSPLAHDFKATVYDHDHVSVISSSGSISRTLHYRGREMAVVKEVSGQLEQVTTSSYTGRLVPSPKGSSLAVSPPCRIVFYPENGGLYENFDNYSFRNRWNDSAPDSSAWKIAPGRLWHNHHQSHRIVSLDPSVLFGQESSAALRCYYSLISPTASMTWNWNNGQVQLARKSTESFSTLNFIFENKSLSTVTNLPNDGELILMTEGNRFFLWIDCVLLVDLVVFTFPNWSSFAFKAQGNCFVEDCVFMANPRTEIEYMNDWGEKIQTIHLESDESVLVSQILYDSLGRPAITTKLTRVTVDDRKPLLTYHSNFISGPLDPGDPLSVWQSHRLQGEVDRLNPLDGGVAYFRTEYEANPLNEKQRKGQPGPDFAVNGPYAMKFRSRINISVIFNHFPTSQGFRHQMEEIPNGTKKVAVLDRQDNRVALYVYVPGYDHLLSTYEYDSKNRLVKMLPPLYHERVDTFGKTNLDFKRSPEEIRWQKSLGTFMKYDDETGRLIRKTTPDTGTMDYYYNREGQIRLQVHSRSEESDEIDSVVYYEYDDKGVVSRTGFLEQMPMSRQQFKKSLEKGTLSNAKDYQLIDRTEVEERHYDPSLSEGERNATFVIHNDDYIVVEDMRWDSQDRLLESKRVGFADSQVRKTFYPQSNNLRTIQYPGIKLEHRYNKLGQLIGLKLDDQSGDLVNFSYHGSGQLDSEYHLPGSRHGFNRTFHYNSPGYLERISDPYLTEWISYTVGGYGQGGFGNGIVMRTTFNATWSRHSDWRWFQVPDTFIQESCLKALKRNGFMTQTGRPIKDYYPAAFMDEQNWMPLVCGGTNGTHISRLLAQKRMPRIYGHRYAYGNHQELVKAKYFTEETEKFTVPFQPDTLADHTVLTKEKSREIWKQIDNAGFLLSDQRNDEWLTVVAHRGSQPLVRRDDLNVLLRSASTSEVDVTLHQDLIEKMILKDIGQGRDNFPNLEEFQKIFLQWKGADDGSSDIEQLRQTAEKIHKHFSKEKRNTSWLDAQLLKIFHPHSKELADFIRILNQHFTYGVGEHQFDVASYDIDANGNHQKFMVGFNIYKFSYGNNANQIRSVKVEELGKVDEESDKPMDHDSQGNVIKALHKGIERIEYNGASMRTSAIYLTDGRKVHFAYDAQGERILKRVLSKDDQLTNETQYVRDEEGRVLFDRRFTYSPKLKDMPLVIVATAYIYGPRGLVGFVRNGAFHSVWADHSGSIRLVLKDGQVVAAYDYFPYGQLMRSYGNNDPASGIFYRYTGQEWDEETGLYNYHARFYDPEIGRFYQPDPREQYFSPYKYVGNSPVSLIDPDGEFAFLFTLSVALLGGAFLSAAAINNKWNPVEWNWKSPKTWLGIIGGGITGAFLPGFSVMAATTAGIPLTVVAAVGGAYISAAANNNNFNFLEWDWENPGTYNALFEGVSTGVGVIGGVGKAHQFANKFGAIGKRSVLTLTYSSVIGFAYGKGVSANAGKWDPTKWDWVNPGTYNALLEGLDSGIGLPTDVMQIGRGIYKLAAKNSKQLKTFFSMMDHVKMKKFKPVLASIAKGPIGKAATGALTAYLMASTANENFDPRGWDATSINTYEGFLNGLFLGIDARKMLKTSGRKQSNRLKEHRNIEPKNPVKSIATVNTSAMMGRAFDNIWKVMFQSAGIHPDNQFNLSQESTSLTLLHDDGCGLQYSANKNQKSFSNTMQELRDGTHQLTTIENANNRKRKRQNEIFVDDESVVFGCVPVKHRRKRTISRKRQSTCLVANPDIQMQQKMKEDPVDFMKQVAISTKSMTDWEDLKKHNIPLINGGTYPFQFIPGASGSSYHLKIGLSHNDVKSVHGYWMNTNEEIRIDPYGKTRFIFTSELQGCSIYTKYNYDDSTMTVYHHNRQFPDSIYLENGRYVHNGKEIRELDGVTELFDGKGNILKLEKNAIVPMEEIYYQKDGQKILVVELNEKKMEAMIKKNLEIKKKEDDLADKYDVAIRHEDYFGFPANYNEKMAKLGHPLTFVTPVLYRDNNDGRWYFSSQKISYPEGLLDKENFHIFSKLKKNFLQNLIKKRKLQDILYQYQIGPGIENKLDSDIFIKRLESIPHSRSQVVPLRKKFNVQKEDKELMSSSKEADNKKTVPIKESNAISVGDLDLENSAKIGRLSRSVLLELRNTTAGLIEGQIKMISSSASRFGSWIDLLSTGHRIFTSILSYNPILEFVKLSLLPDDATEYRNSVDLSPPLSANRSDYREVLIGNCYSISPDEIVCYGYCGKTTVFTHSPKADTLQRDTYSHCRPIEWHGQPSITCLGEETTFIHTPYNTNSAATNLFHALDGWLILAQAAPGIYREIVKFAEHVKNVWKGNIVNVSISDKDKESWHSQLRQLEQLVAKQQPYQLNWASPLISELRQQISSLSGKTHTETMDDVRAVKTMTERLSALMEDVEEIEQNQVFYDCLEEFPADEPQSELTSAEWLSSRLHHLTSLAKNIHI